MHKTSRATSATSSTLQGLALAASGFTLLTATIVLGYAIWIARF